MNEFTKHICSSEFRFHIHYFGGNSGSRSHPLHSHNYFEILFVAEGGGACRIDNKKLSLKKGDLLLIPPNTLHNIIRDTYIATFYMGFSAFPSKQNQSSEAVLQQLSSVKVIELKRQSAVELLWQSINSACSEPYQLPGSVITNITLSLIQSLMNIWMGPPSTYQSETKDLPNELTSDIIHYINDHLFQINHVDEISKHFHISTRHITRKFNAVTGLSIASYIRNEKIKWAKKLLIESSLPISTISEHLNYSSVHHFSKAFRSMMGIPPSAYRASHCSEQAR